MRYTEKRRAQQAPPPTEEFDAPFTDDDLAAVINNIARAAGSLRETADETPPTPDRRDGR